MSASVVPDAISATTGATPDVDIETLVPNLVPTRLFSGESSISMTTRPRCRFCLQSHAPLHKVCDCETVVHLNCLQHWVRTRPVRRSLPPNVCEICHTEYTVVEKQTTCCAPNCCDPRAVIGAILLCLLMIAAGAGAAICILQLIASSTNNEYFTWGVATLLFLGIFTVLLLALVPILRQIRQRYSTANTELSFPSPGQLHAPQNQQQTTRRVDP